MKRLAISAAAILAAVSLQAQEWAVTTVSANYLRSEPSYESSLETQTLMGSVLQAGEREGRWISVVPHSPAYDACWTNVMTVALMDDAELSAYLAAEKYIVTAEYSRVTDLPVGGNVVCDLVMGDLLRKVYNDKGKAVHTVTHAKVLLPDGRTGYVKYGDVNDFKSWLDLRKSAAGDDIVATARRFNGVPYLWGGNSIKGVDCSGLVWMSYFMNGIILPRNASQMARCGVEIPLQGLQSGDLLFYGNDDGSVTHVAIYTGDAGIIHSSQIVYEASIDPDSPYYYDREILFARRICGHLSGGELTAVRVLDSPWYIPGGKTKIL